MIALAKLLEAALFSSAHPVALSDLKAIVNDPKVKPEDVAAQIFAALAEGKEEVLADDLTRQVKLGINAELPAYIAAARPAA